MTRDELKNLSLNQRVRMFHLKRDLTCVYLYGSVVGIYNGNWQVKVLFDGETKGRVVGYRQLDCLLDTNIKP